MPKPVFIPKEENLQTLLINSFSNHLMGFSEEEKNNLTDILKVLLKNFHETSIDDYKASPECITALHAFDSYLGRIHSYYDIMHGEDIRAEIANKWRLLCCYEMSCPDNQKTKKGLEQFSASFKGSNKEDYDKLYDNKSEFMIDSYAYKGNALAFESAADSCFSFYRRLGNGYPSSVEVDKLEEIANNLENAISDEKFLYDLLKEYVKEINECEEDLELPKSQAKQELDDLKEEFNNSRKLEYDEKTQKLRDNILYHHPQSVPALSERLEELQEFYNDINKKFESLDDPDAPEKIDMDSISPLKDRLSEFKNDMDYRILKAGDSIFKNLGLDTEEFGYSSDFKGIIDSAKEGISNYEKLLELATQKEKDLRLKIKNPDAFKQDKEDPEIVNRKESDLADEESEGNHDESVDNIDNSNDESYDLGIHLSNTLDEEDRICKFGPIENDKIKPNDEPEAINPLDDSPDNDDESKFEDSDLYGAHIGEIDNEDENSEEEENPLQDEVELRFERYWDNLTNALRSEIMDFNDNRKNTLLPLDKLADLTKCHERSEEVLLLKGVSAEYREPRRINRNDVVSETYDTLSDLINDSGIENSYHDKRKEFFEVCDVIMDTKDRGLFANHDLFNNMTAQLERYKATFSNAGAYQEKALREIAQDTKKACLLYLNKHLGSDKNNQAIGGQGTTDGIVRKQAVVRMLELMTQLPEFTKQDVPADTANLKVSFKDLNFNQLKNSLAAKSGTAEGSLEERSYGDLNKAKAAKAAKNGGRKL